MKTTEDHAGLFGTLDLNGIAKNLIFVNPTVEVTNSNQYAGVLAGETNYTYDGKGQATNVDSIFVYGAKIAYPLTAQEIADYTATGEPMDKAGAYGIQGRGALLVKRIEGDYYNVMGLPAGEVYHRLEELGAL